jgi:two-component system response regulator PrrA
MVHNTAWAQVGATSIILVVDDDSAYIEFIKSVLRWGESFILTARDGREAIDCALRAQPDLIIMNWWMPVMDGLETTKTLRALGYPGRIFMDTAFQDTPRRIAALNAGANAFISRPWDVAEYVALVRAVMR